MHVAILYYTTQIYKRQATVQTTQHNAHGGTKHKQCDKCHKRQGIYILRNTELRGSN